MNDSFIQKEGYSVKKSEVLSVSPITPQKSGNVLGNNNLIKYIDERMTKLKDDGLDVSDVRDLVIRNYKEYVAVTAIREKQKHVKAKNTQELLNKLKKLL